MHPHRGIETISYVSSGKMMHRDSQRRKIKYVEQDGNWVVNSTFVRPDYTGQGIAGLLLAEIVKQAREKGVKIVPECSYVESAFEKKEKYADVWAK